MARDGRGAAVPCWFKSEERPGPGRLRVTTPCNSRTGALFAMQHNGWDHALKVTADGTGLVGHAGAVLLRKAADQAGLTGQLSAALRKAGTSPVSRPGDRAGLAGGRDRARRDQHERHRPAGAPGPGAGGRAERADGAPGPGPGRDGGRAGPDRPRPGESPRARVGPDRGHARRVPVAGRRGEDADGLAGHRHGRHPGHRQLGQGRRGSHLEEGLRLPPTGRLAREHPRVPGHAAAPRQRRVEHVHRP